MEAVLRWAEHISEAINQVVWGPAMLAFLLLVGLQFSLRTGFFQFRCARLWLKMTLGKLLGTRKKVKKARLVGKDAGREEKKAISPFQAMSTALAGAIGTGNIVGVATAITLGGPGAIFWMWVAAVLGMMTVYAENLLGVKYRVRNAKGQWVGGPMYYIENGLHCKWLAVVFAVACTLATFGIGNMTQANSIAAALQETFALPPAVTGIVLAVLVGCIIFGGIGRIAKVTEKIVPFMALFYLVGGLVVIFAHVDRIPSAVQSIFQQAFSLQAAAGGVGGTVMQQAVKYGIARGVFTNEAGLGSSPIVHAAADAQEPAEQGMWGIFQVFLDTIVMCTVTALCLLTAGVWEPGKDGAAMSTAAFATVFGRMGAVFVAVSITLFAFATLISWSYYGERGLAYLAGEKPVAVYKALYAIAAAFGCAMNLRLVWSIADCFNGLMAIPNLVALLLLSGQVVAETKRYLRKKKDGQ
ncbi:MAG TPA: sodium:alanine symporter family protein [Candidatus Gallacutalibacter stercoravium]|nr:sodium:alanine symporter family protein [Candidatus Gallacutalibacter stercoravium]